MAAAPSDPDPGTGTGSADSAPAVVAEAVQRVAEALRRLAPDAERLVVAVSGGGDSVALLWLLRELAVRGDGPALVAAHLDHGLRPASADDAAWVDALAAGWGIPVARERIDVAAIAEARGWNLEAGARKLRYAFLHRVAGEVEADAIAVAHTRDDQAETVLLQLLRGAAFLGGMPPRRGRVIRPALEHARADLRAVLEVQGIEARDDASNRDTARRRAALRHDVLPRLEALAPGVADRLARLATVQRDQRSVLEAEARRRFGVGSLALGALAGSPPALQRTAIALLLRSAGAPVDLATIDELRDATAVRASDPTRPPWRRDVGRGVRLRIHDGRLEALAGGSVLPRSDADGDATPASTRDERVDEGPLASRLAAARVADPPPPASLLARADDEPDLTWRARRPGDRIALPGGTKTVAELMIDRKIPREARAGIPLIARGNEVLWVQGVATARSVDVDAEDAPADPEREAMGRALAAARAAGAAGEIPIGAVVLDGAGAVLAVGENRTRRDTDPSAHAEVVALRAAARARGDWRLDGCTLVVTLEPCPMCYGAALTAHLERIVWGAPNARDGAIGSVVDLGAAPTKRHPSLRGGVRAGECARLVEDFFAARR